MKFGEKIKKKVLPIQIVENWLNMLRNGFKHWYDSEQQPDVPWRYGERSLLSLLAGVVWISNGLAILEFETEKEGNDSNFGRADMFIEFNKETFEAEAKLADIEIDDIGQMKEKLYKTKMSNSLKDALKDIQRNKIYNARRKQLAVAFIRPIIKNTDKNMTHYMKNYMSEIEKFKSALLSLNYSCAWFFPPKPAIAIYPDSYKKDYFFPGVAFIVAERDA